MKIGVIGSGNIGGNLGKHWAKAGHEVLFSSRHPEQLGDLVRECEGNAKAVSVAEAFEANADVYLLATPFKAIDELAELYAGEYGDRVIIDATNPYPERDGKMAKDVKESNRNASEYIAMKFNTAKTAKAFNTIHAEHLKNRAWRTNDKIAIPFAAQDADSSAKTKQLIEDIGFDSVYVGDLTKTKQMDPDQKLYGKSVGRQELEDLMR
ncbi:NADP oxidoreductase [Subsaximicrobium wynnwilliamsii]|uniref:NADP oxidoreductase n=1 Tax=Subsaximicrobium wynnwilliamsii TaxID=291179 RepID=A0A5C6ZGC4_9FLAO|nr:NAD(P)-binding domain-containing protein [Subsaximicrobium wynnwilliamsii]TXD84047.1 NADP oxidoreductase [Subsaximicrobium wynnwilliamsii]TXD88995.1 NADP oxidoreductase [Subsaximicrobium wynnwilliamsii]TXE03759.1 NADP oxidoreductase [Subsaximicrobium wynnwilliamsii]